MSHINQYKKLTLNTLLISLGTIGSKIISILMLRFYTDILTPSEYGLLDLLSQTANLIIPVAMLGISAGIVRFGLDKRYQKSDVFTTALLSLGAGFIFCLLFAPLLALVNDIGDYVVWLYAYILAASLQLLCATFVRSEESVSLYAFNGIFNTVCNVGLMFVFLRGFSWGVTGYLLAVICADLLSSLFLVIRSKLWTRIKFKPIPPAIAKPMLLYSIPIIPTTINWFIMNTSDRFILRYFHGNAANGLFAVAAKIPLMITIMAGVFLEAWQISIIGTQTKKQQSRFFSTIIQSYQAVLFVMASGIILFSRLVIRFMTSQPSFYEAWRYVPFLVCGTIFSCLATFIGSIYTVEKKSIALMLTTLIGGVLNLVLNFLFIPHFGANGAAFTTFVSFVVIFFIRIVHTKQYIAVRWAPVQFILSLLLLLLQSLIMIWELRPVYLWQALCLVIIGVINLKQMMIAVQKVLHRKRTKKA